MTVLLPKPGHTVHELVGSLNPDSWQTMVEGLHSKEGTVQLPRFRMEWEKVLNETLSEQDAARITFLMERPPRPRRDRQSADQEPAAAEQ